MQQSSIRPMDPPNQDIGPKIPHKSKDLQREQNGSMIMNQRNLQIICENEGLYEFPEMNTKIYLHFKVIQKIQNLNKYVNLKTIYLENNVITKIENLQCLTHLQNLFLQNNMIKKIQNLQKLKELRVINLSNNNIFKIQGLSELLHLQNLNLANNYLAQFDDLQHLGQCTTELTSIDLSNNHIKPNQQLLNLIPQVKCLYLSGNPLVRQTKHYRRVVVGTLKNLLYLDQRGIDKEQRMLSQAWVEGGQKAFKQAREKVQQHRLSMKEQKRQQIMKDIDVHRNRKVGIFLRNIKEFEQEIQKLRGYMNEKGNEDMTYFYESKIAQLYQKIRQNQEFVNNINKRIGASAKSTSSGQSNPSCNQSEQSVCSDNKSQGQEVKLQVQNNDEKQKLLQKQELDEDEMEELQQIDQKITDFPKQQTSSQDLKKQFVQKCNLNEQQSSQLSFSDQKSEVIKPQIQKKNMVPAPSTGLDELD